jgi:hypothetical protein
MSTNEGTVDRIVRTAVGLLLIALVFVGPKTAWGWLGSVPLLTGLVGYCPVYSWFKVST